MILCVHVLKYGRFPVYLVHMYENLWGLDSQTLVSRSMHLYVFLL